MKIKHIKRQAQQKTWLRLRERARWHKPWRMDEALSAQQLAWAQSVYASTANDRARAAEAMLEHHALNKSLSLQGAKHLPPAFGALTRRCSNP